MAIGTPINMFHHFIIPTMNLDLAKPKNTDIIPGMIKNQVNKIIFHPRAALGLQRVRSLQQLKIHLFKVMFKLSFTSGLKARGCNQASA